jgi:DNA-binding transcriptional ArsR family regulator
MRTLQTDRLSSTFAALADPTRRAILARLASGEAPVTELAAPFSMSLPAISKHLKVLEGAGLITRGREAQWRPCRLEATPLKEATDWLARYERFWSEGLDRLAAFLESDSTPAASPELAKPRARRAAARKTPRRK